MDNLELAKKFLKNTEYIEETAQDRDPCGFCDPHSDDDCESCPNNIHLVIKEKPYA
jgi:hypothetical protein